MGLSLTKTDLTKDETVSFRGIQATGHKLTRYHNQHIIKKQLKIKPPNDNKCLLNYRHITCIIIDNKYHGTRLYIGYIKFVRCVDC